MHKPVGFCTVLGKSFPFMEHGSFSSSKEYCPDFQASGSRFLLRAFGMISGIFPYMEKIVDFPKEMPSIRMNSSGISGCF